MEAMESMIEEFSNPGEKFDAGCDENNIERYMSICRSINSRKQVCAVKRWQWWDFDIEEEPADIYHKTGRYPCLINADHVIVDQAGRFMAEEWVRSSLLMNFSHNCIFETSNTFYLLVGGGTRKTISLELANAIF